jgi:small subunit ribosomal protein S16
MVKIRLSRHGANKRPFYQIVVADGRARRDGQFIEKIGFFNPVARGAEERLRFNQDRYEFWLKNGAQASNRVSSLAVEANKQQAAAKPDAEGEATQIA